MTDDERPLSDEEITEAVTKLISGRAPGSIRALLEDVLPRLRSMPRREFYEALARTAAIPESEIIERARAGYEERKLFELADVTEKLGRGGKA